MATSAVLLIGGSPGSVRAEEAVDRVLEHVRTRSAAVLARGAVDAGLLAGDTAHAAETAAGPAFVAAVHVAFAEGEPEPDRVLQGLAGALQGVADPSACAVVAGTEHVIVPGEQPLLLAMAIRRLPALTHERFVEHWSTVHAELGRGVPGSEGYRQVRTDAALMRRVAPASGLGVVDLDGAALAYYSGPEAMLRILGDPDVSERLMADERTFIDHGGSAMVCGWSR